MALRDEYQERLRKHPFYDWVRRKDVPTDKKLAFMPVMALFVMNFRDMNLWVIRFPDDEGDALKQVINGSTTEDETHSRLYLEDWRKLHLDDRLGWRASDVLWWLFLSEDMEEFRRVGVEFMRLSVDDHDDPLVRFAHSEAGEACGHVFFEHFSPLAEELGKAQGLNYRYFGLFHLELETGHVLESEDVFQDQPLTEAQYALGIELAKRMFGIFDAIHDAFFAYAERYVMTDTRPRRPEVSFTPARPDDDARSPAAAPAAGFSAVHDSQRDLDLYHQHRATRAAAHPFYEWLAGAALPPVERLQRFLPIWAFDMLGYRDLNKYVFHYANPGDELERAVNEVAANLASHSQLFLNDWLALGLDAALRWPASDTMDFLFLDSVMDRHRHTLIAFGMLGLRHQNAIERLWLMEALETSGHAFFRATRDVALAAEQEAGIRLDYLADRHAMVHPTGKPKTVNFKERPLEVAQQRAVRTFIDVVYDALETNLGLSLEAAQANKLAIRPLRR
ncbi:MAG: hypothetical protein R3B72_49770 [Polyangiaceae bacterium]